MLSKRHLKYRGSSQLGLTRKSHIDLRPAFYENLRVFYWWLFLNFPYYCPNKPQKVGFWSKKVAFYYIFSKWRSNREWWPFICTDMYRSVIHFRGRKLYVKQGPPVCITNNILVMEEFNNIIQEFDIHVIIIITTKPIMTIWCLEWFLPMFFALFPDDYHCSVPRLNIKLP